MASLRSCRFLVAYPRSHGETRFQLFNLLLKTLGKTADLTSAGIEWEHSRALNHGLGRVTPLPSGPPAQEP